MPSNSPSRDPSPSRSPASASADDRVRFEVSDTGIGIEPDDLDRMFEPFTQADVSTTRRHGGNGLGLAIVKDLIERMNGTITAQSRPRTRQHLHLRTTAPPSPAKSRAPNATLTRTRACSSRSARSTATRSPRSPTASKWDSAQVAGGRVAPATFARGVSCAGPGDSTSQQPLRCRAPASQCRVRRGPSRERHASEIEERLGHPVRMCDVIR